VLVDVLVYVVGKVVVLGPALKRVKEYKKALKSLTSVC
jgi:hypothetical protein